MNVTRIGLDLAKNVYQVHGVDRPGKGVVKRQLKGKDVEAYFKALPPCVIGMEACSGAHYWGRKFAAMGHTVKLMAPQFVKPYVKGNKNDARDAEAICEAVGRPNMRFVPLKTAAQQDMLLLHRARSGTIKARTAQANQIRGLLAEYGIVVPVGIGKLRKRLPEILEDGENGLNGMERAAFAGLWEELRHLDERVAAYDRQITELAREDPRCKRLLTARGVGEMTATALVAAVGDGTQFANGREMAAWLGLVPGQHSSGGKERLLGISKRGDVYLRTLLIHGARSVIRSVKDKTDRLSVWGNEVVARRGKNVAAVALANKNARMLWAMLTRGEDYCPRGNALAPELAAQAV